MYVPCSYKTIHHKQFNDCGDSFLSLKDLRRSTRASIAEWSCDMARASTTAATPTRPSRKTIMIFRTVATVDKIHSQINQTTITA